MNTVVVHTLCHVSHAEQIIFDKMEHYFSECFVCQAKAGKYSSLSPAHRHMHPYQTIIDKDIWTRTWFHFSELRVHAFVGHPYMYLMDSIQWAHKKHPYVVQLCINKLSMV